MPEKLKMHSPDLVQSNIERIAEMFPNCVTEAADDDGQIARKIDFDLLRQELSGEIVEGPLERYHLNWPGKREAMLAANAPIAKTLRPCREESVDFDTTQNLFIEGDNLEALKLLQETYLGKVKMIYIDPPYNTGNDLVYEDTFSADSAEYLLSSSQDDIDGNRLVLNQEANGRFHSDWLNMIFPRLRLARNLLRDDGLVFISIGDDEQASLKRCCDEVFGSLNFLGCACRVSKKTSNQGEFWSPNFDFVLTYAKSKPHCRGFFGGVNYDAYDQIEDEGPRKGERYQLVRLYMTSLDPMRGCSNQRYYVEAPDGTLLIPPGNTFPVDRKDGVSTPPKTAKDKVWRWARESYLLNKDRIVVKRVRSSNLVDADGNEVKWNVFTKTYLQDVISNTTAKPNSLIEGHINQNSSHELGLLNIPFSFAKPVSLIRYLIDVARVEKSDIVMDFFAGSGTTAHAVMSHNADKGEHLKSICVQFPEPLSQDGKGQSEGFDFCESLGRKHTIAEISKERIRRAGSAVKETNALTSAGLDVGFRVLSIDSSNMKDVYYSPADTSQAMLGGLVDNIKPDRSGEDLLFQVLLDCGVDLGLPIKTEAIDGCEVFFVNDSEHAAPDLIACFDADIPDSLVKTIAAKSPLRAVFRDGCFASDADKINVEQVFKQMSPQTQLKSL